MVFRHTDLKIPAVRNKLSVHQISDTRYQRFLSPKAACAGSFLYWPQVKGLLFHIQRLNINESDIDKLTKTALEYFHANSLFLNTRVTPTIWTIGHVLPVHTKYIYEVYGQGLLTVSMKGREAKHIAFQRLDNNTTYQNHWQEIFRHEFIMPIWLS